MLIINLSDINLIFFKVVFQFLCIFNFDGNCVKEWASIFVVIDNLKSEIIKEWGKDLS